MRRRVALLSAATAVALLAPAVPAEAGTSASDPDKDNVVTITVPVDCVGCAGKKAPDSKTDLARYWEQTAEAFWNRAFKRFKYCNTYELRLDIDMQNRDPNTGSSFGRHRVTAAGASSARTPSWASTRS